MAQYLPSLSRSYKGFALLAASGLLAGGAWMRARAQSAELTAQKDLQVEENQAAEAAATDKFSSTRENINDAQGKPIAKVKVTLPPPPKNWALKPFPSGNVADLVSHPVGMVSADTKKLEFLMNPPSRADKWLFGLEGNLRWAGPVGNGGGGGGGGKDPKAAWGGIACQSNVDLDVDSDNDAGRGGAASRSEAEDKVEMTAPGKYVEVNDGDANDNQIPDFAELTGGSFTPIEVELSSDIDLTKATLELTYDASVPGAAPVGGVYTPAVGKLRLWTQLTTGQPRKVASVVDDGNFVPSGAVPPAKLGLSGTTRKVTLLMEGIRPSAAAGDVKITLTVDPDGSGPMPAVKDEVLVTVYKIDVDVDSDNKDGIDDAEFCLEDQIEDDSKKPGKFVGVNDGDQDGDGIPDFADGFDLDGASGTAEEKVDDVSGGVKFTPMKLRVSKAVDLSKAKFKVEAYGQSDPANVTVSGTAPNLIYTPAAGKLRLWKKDGDQARKKASIASSGDFIPAGEYTAAQLGLTATTAGAEVELFIEGVRPSAAAGDLPVKIKVLPTGVEASGGFAEDQVRVTNVGVDLAVDFNRDGNIEFEPYGGGSPDATQNKDKKRYEFWVNNDDDQRYEQNNKPFYDETEEDDRDVSQTSHRNWESDHIECRRDLEDFTRLWVGTSRLGPLMSKLVSGELKLRVKFIESQASIKVFRAADPTGGLAHLENSSVADIQIDQSGSGYGNTLGGMGFNGGVTLPSEIITMPVVPLLFEGAADPGKGYLVPVIEDGQGHEIIRGRGVWLDLKDPKDFIERYTCGEGSGGDVAPAATVHSGSGPKFPAPATNEEKDYVLYVHGYNMDPNSKQRWIETTFKRLYWLNFKGRVGGFSWPCTYGTAGEPFFDQSEYRAWQSGSPLMGHLNNLKQRGYRVHMMAHSQGNIVAGEALRLWSRGATESLVKTYVAAQAAIPAHCYDKDDAQALLMPNHDADTYNVYRTYWTQTSDNNRPALWNVDNPSYLDADLTRVAAEKWVNFYNPRDYALTGGTLLHPGWELVQKQKPDNALSTDDSCEYSYMDAFGFWKESLLTTTFLKFPDDRYRIFSYGAGAWSKALGACDTHGLFADSAIDLNTTFLYGEEHLWHSGQFRSFFADRRGYWSAFKDEIIPSAGGNP